MNDTLAAIFFYKCLFRSFVSSLILETLSDRFWGESVIC